MQYHDEIPDSQTRTDIQHGTHAMAGYAGTISFPRGFAGTAIVSLQLMAGSESFGNLEPLKTPSLFSGSFTYTGSPGHGTFSWQAVGPAR